MKTNIFPFVLCIFSFLFYTSCEDNSEDTPAPSTDEMGVFELNITTLVSGAGFSPGVVYKNPKGREYFVSALKMYISDITLIDESGEETLLSEIELFDLTQPGALKVAHGDGTFKQFEVPAKKYVGVRFGIGVPDSLNHEDPTVFSPEHPLSVFNSMHWNWAAGYRFVIMEGKIDSSVTADGAEIAKDFVYHLGLDTLYRTMEYMAPDQSFTVPTGDELQYTIELDLNRIFFREGDTLDIVARPTTHSVPPGSEAFQLAETLMDNLAKNAIFKVPF
ncbi:MAG: MbnP family protein [Bacteroidota bacterium]